MNSVIEDKGMEKQTHTSTPWTLEGRHIYSPEGEANIATVSSPRTGRFIGYYDLQIADPDFHEAYANAELIVRAVNNHDALIDEVKELRRMLCAVAPLAYKREVIPHLPGNWGDEIKAWLKGRRTEDVIEAAEGQS